MESDNQDQKEDTEVKAHKVKKKAKHEPQKEAVDKEAHMVHSEEKKMEQAEQPEHQEHTSEHQEHPEQHEHLDHHVEKSMWAEMGTWRFIAIVIALLLIVSIFTNGFNFAGNSVKATLNEEQAVQKTLDFVNNNLLQPGLGATSSGSEDVGDLYKINLNVAGQSFESYLTKDGRLLFPQGFDLTAAQLANQPGAQQNVPVVDVSADDDPVRGDANAPVTIIEFSDFQCPFCERFFSGALPEIEEKYIKTGKVKFVFRDFPLESIHPQAMPAAQAAECANEQGKFWDYHDKLFGNQQLLSTDNYKKWAVELGLNEEKFNDCVDSKKYASEVQKDLDNGAAAGVTGTPAFFINGKSVSGAQPFSVFEAMIEAELNAEESNPKEVSDEIATAPITNEDNEASSMKESISITAKKYRFVPNQFTVKKGTAVDLLVKSTDVGFGFELPDFGVSLDLIPGETATAQFVADKVGEFTFQCSNCEGKESVMVGKMKVE